SFKKWAPKYGILSEETLAALNSIENIRHPTHVLGVTVTKNVFLTEHVSPSRHPRKVDVAEYLNGTGKLEIPKKIAALKKLQFNDSWFTEATAMSMIKKMDEIRSKFQQNPNYRKPKRLDISREIADSL
uniref:Uncharacterized protein n=1 Tax=Panagrolaimus sp. ES5 TaxID=591445 RepID=A0AC34FDQ3_9BILA